VISERECGSLPPHAFCKWCCTCHDSCSSISRYQTLTSQTCYCLRPYGVLLLEVLRHTVLHVAVLPPQACKTPRTSAKSVPQPPSLPLQKDRLHSQSVQKVKAKKQNGGENKKKGKTKSAKGVEDKKDKFQDVQEDYAAAYRAWQQSQKTLDCYHSEALCRCQSSESLADSVSGRVFMCVYAFALRFFL